MPDISRSVQPVARTNAITRREFCGSTIATASTWGAVAFLCRQLNAEQSSLAGTSDKSNEKFRLNYIVGSAMYGKLSLAEILPEVRKTGAEYIEIWANPHGNQREEIDELGVEKTLAMLEQHQVKLGSFTCFKYGIFNMQGEMQLVKQLGGDLVICNSGGPRNLSGPELKQAVLEFAEKLKPHVAAAEELGISIGVENHSGGVINTPDSIRYLVDAIDSPALGLAMAPYHLPQDPAVIARLIVELGPRLNHFQAWEHGAGSSGQLSKEDELKQLPHRGPLDWCPIVAALKQIHFAGRTQIFMHPIPRGIPILPEVSAVTAEINAGRALLEACLNELS